MADWKDWYYGTKRCRIRQSDIMSPGMQGPRKHFSAQIMNAAFDGYFQGHQAAQKITDVLYLREYRGVSKDKVWALRDAMSKDLRDAADAGWYDLRNVFKHIAENNGKFREDVLNGYGKQLCNVPMGVSNFLDAVKERGGRFSRSAADWTRYKDRIEYEAGKKKWSNVGDYLGKMQSAMDDVGPYIWVCIPGHGARTPHYVALVSKWVGYGAQIHGVLNKELAAEQRVYQAHNSPHFKQEMFVEGLALLVGRLPLMGSLYAEAIRQAPTAIAYFTKVAKERDAYIEQIMQGI